MTICMLSGESDQDLQAHTNAKETLLQKYMVSVVHLITLRRETDLYLVRYA